MVRDWWDDPNFSHGFLVPLFSAYLLWERRHTLRFFPSGSSAWPGLTLLVVALVILVFGKAGGEYFTMRLSLVLVLASFCYLISGLEGLKICLFPLAFMIFMIPIPYILYDSIAFPLKLVASRIGEFSLHAVGIPVFREGNIIHLSTLQLEVADACSGIRSLVSLTALATVSAYFFGLGMFRGAILFLSGVPVSVGTNSIRIFMTGIISNKYGPKFAHGFFHGVSGWLIFLLGLAIMVALGLILRRTGVKRRHIS